MFLELFVLKNVSLQYIEAAEGVQSAIDFYQFLQTGFIYFTYMSSEKTNSYFYYQSSVISRRVYSHG